MTQHDFLESTYREWRKRNYRGAVPVEIDRWTWEDRIHAAAIVAAGVVILLLTFFMVRGM